MVDRIVWKILLDFIVLACVSIPLLYLYIWAKPYEQGYFENDTSIRLPYREESIHEAVLSGSCFTLMVFTVLIIEIIRDRQGKGVGEKFLGGVLIPGWMWSSYNTLGIYTFGAACQQLTSDFSKYVIGRLRPHFYDVCRPVPITSPLNSLGYIQAFTCSNSDEAQLRNTRLSFPSAHASFSMYTAIFFICYVQVKGKWRGSKLLRHSIQLVAFLSSWYVGFTRIRENFHHWTDVAAGFLIGVAYGFLVFIFVLKPKDDDTALVWDEPAPQSVLPRPALAR